MKSMTPELQSKLELRIARRNATEAKVAAVAAADLLSVAGEEHDSSMLEVYCNISQAVH